MMDKAGSACPNSVSLASGIVVLFGVFGYVCGFPLTMIGISVGAYALALGVLFFLIAPGSVTLGRGLTKGRTWAWYGTSSIFLLVLMLIVLVIGGVPGKLNHSRGLSVT
jgi:hypothetical protein